MLSFCALFILSICRSTSCIPKVAECLENVTDVAQLMIDISINSEHKPYVQGTLILKQVEDLKNALEYANRGGNETRNESGIGLAAQRSSLGVDGPDSGIFAMESLWDFSMLFQTT